MGQERLGLDNICEGKINEQFMRRYPEILENIKPGQKSTVTITMVIARPEGTNTMASISSKMAVKMPAAASVAGLYPFNSKFEIQADAIQEPQGKQGVIAFPTAK